MRHIVVMVTTSYPRFPGDGVGSFIEPIAKGVAARGHEVHLVAPWHPSLNRPKVDEGVHFHFFRYAPVAPLNVFGYATGLRADTQLRLAAWMMAPLAMASGSWKTLRVAQKRHATVMHAHWVIPGGAIAALASRSLPLVVSVHGSDVFVAERSAPARLAARRVFRRAAWVTACSNDLAERATHLGADASRLEVVPYGVDTYRFRPQPAARTAVRRELGLGDAPVVFTAGRLVQKKGFSYLIDAVDAREVPRYPTPADIEKWQETSPASPKNRRGSSSPGNREQGTLPSRASSQAKAQLRKRENDGKADLKWPGGRAGSR